MKFPLNILVLVLVLLSLCCGTVSCSSPKEQETLDRAEALMESHPDSALSLLSSIDKRKLSGKRQNAQYALLMSMALDKNYVDTTTFDVLQPAIDYYLEKGTPDEKLKTYYYQGIIYFNKGERDSAMNSFVKGLDCSYDCTDSLVIARALVAQGELHNDMFDFERYISCNLEAAKIYNDVNFDDNEIVCLLNALNGAVLLRNKTLGDSVLNCIQGFPSLNRNQQQAFTRQKMSFAIKFGTEEEIRNLIQILEASKSSQNDVFFLALAYNKIGNDNKAIELLDFIKNSRQPYDTLRYLSISVPAFEGLGNYKEALSLYKQYSHKRDSIDLLKFEIASKSMEERHKIELKAQEDAKDKSMIIWGCAGGIAFLCMVILILYLLFRSNKSKKDLAVERVKISELKNKQLKSDHESALQKARITELENERLRSENELALQKAKITQLENGRLKSERHQALQQARITGFENECLKSEKEKLALENRNLQLERDKKALEAENLVHRVETLENESESLKSLISEKEELPEEVQKEIKVRIEMLNALLAGYITNNDQYEKPYDVWIKELTDNKDEFMNSNRLAFQVSHPRFIQYFADHGLITEEINYVCLYAIGLRGKEVGNYMKKRSHVNTSSAIRKKLGIDRHETNIGIYVRKLLRDL